MTPQKSIAEFQKFTVEEWAEWITLFVSGDSREPLWPVWDDGYVEQLSLIRRKLAGSPQARSRMSDGLALALETTPPEPAVASVLYYLLHATAVIVPLKARKLLHKLLRTRAFEGLEYADMRLETLLLSAATEYGPDEHLTDFINSAAPRAADIAFLLTSFRYLASHNLANTWTVTSSILSRERDTGSEQLFADELKIVADESHWSALYGWYCDSLTALPDELSFKLLAIINTHVIPFFEDDEQATQESAYQLMTAHVAVALHRFTSSHLLTLLGHVSSERGAARKRGVGGIRSIYEFGLRLDPAPPWFYTDNDDLTFRTGTARGEVGLVSRDDPPPRRETRLRKDQHRELIDILIEATPQPRFPWPAATPGPRPPLNRPSLAKNDRTWKDPS